MNCECYRLNHDGVNIRSAEPCLSADAKSRAAEGHLGHERAAEWLARVEFDFGR
jgi:hypothetical protein